MPTNMTKIAPVKRTKKTIVRKSVGKLYVSEKKAALPKPKVVTKDED
jgi:hypothetical protein